jgi:Kef-type K+ transport system membrane component KefB
MPTSAIHPHDIGLPPPVVRTRRHAHRIARWMLAIAVVTAIPGWLIFGISIFSAVNVKSQSPYQAIGAYALLIVSSVTLVLGLWYLLLAQVGRIARIVTLEQPPLEVSSNCGNCGWPHDGPDRFCRHCGKALTV